MTRAAIIATGARRRYFDGAAAGDGGGLKSTFGESHGVAIGFLFTRLSLIEIAVAFGAALCLLGDFP
ncbi:hypothetical protein AB2C92_34345, partial [Pseudomonas aeruginosa]